MMETAIGIPAGTTVLVTGATGFTGAVLTRKLVQAGCNVRAIARLSSDVRPLSDLDIQWFRGNVYDSKVVQEATEGVAYIFHVAAAFRAAGVKDDIYSKVHIEGTRLLAEAVVGKPTFKRFVHVSTIGVHSHIAHPPADEDYPFNPDDLYQQTKAKAEKWLHRFAADHGLPYTVIRPAAIFGPDDRRFLKFFKMISKGWLPLLGGHDTQYHLTHVDDLTNVFILAATHPEAEGEVFICGNDESTTLTQMGGIIAEVCGKKVRTVALPKWPFFTAASVCECICRPFGLEPPIHKRRAAFFTKDRSFDTKKLRNKLGYQNRYSNRTGLEQTARSYIEKKWI